MTEPSAFLEGRLAGEQQTLARPLRALVRRDPVVCRPEALVREAVRLMNDQGVGSVIIVDERGAALGLFTTTDVVAAAAARDLDHTTVGELMSRDLISLPGHAFAYEAALAMVAHRIRHVLVVEDGRPVGMVSERDLFSLQRLGLGEITTGIRAAGSVELLADIAEEIRRLARLLVQQGVAAEPLTHFVSVLNDRLCQRVIEIARKGHHWEHISWTWLAFGSEGRFEQTFSTDQDNGILFVAHDGQAPEAARERLLPFAHQVNVALDACGFPLCKGNIMASNPKLCLSLEEWRARMSSWVDTPEPQALLDATICFDFRALFGDSALATTLREWLLARTRANRAFLRHMAQNAVQARPPLGRIRTFVTEKGPGAQRTINLKLYGVRPFVDAARVYALGAALPQTNTAERLRAAREALALGASETEALIGAFHVIQRLRLQNQAAPAAPGDAANRIDPASLNELDQSILKESFRQARRLQQRLELDYQL